MTKKIKVEEGSNVANILNGKTRGYHNWYVKHIMQNSDLYVIIKKIK
jgi:hypothetical protein|tara:strand:+ start:404 stop:544 length:141 start_codon:yes stop_codon:yes gene_type:complete